MVAEEARNHGETYEVQVELVFENAEVFDVAELEG
jgi:hypothetical protein